MQECACGVIVDAVVEDTGDDGDLFRSLGYVGVHRLRPNRPHRLSSRTVQVPASRPRWSSLLGVQHQFGNGLYPRKRDAGALLRGQWVVGGFQFHRRADTDGLAVHLGLQVQRRRFVFG